MAFGAQRSPVEAVKAPKGKKPPRAAKQAPEAPQKASMDEIMARVARMRAEGKL